MPSMNANNDRVAAASGKEYWRSLEELADTPEFRELVYREFPRGATEMLDSGERRRFLQIMGASMALAGVGLAGCRRWPRETIAPYANRPEGRMPGVPEYYATSMDRAGSAGALLVTSYDGRPTKIEGNPEHPMNAGATDGWAQASILELYDPDRSRHVMHAVKDGARQRSDWARFMTWAQEHFKSLANARGGGLHVLTEASSSPSLRQLKAQVAERFPRAEWHEYEPINNDAEVEGATGAFGAPYRTHYDFARARVVVSLDADFLMMHPAAVKHMRDWAMMRRADDAAMTMSRLYVFESGYSVTGANADNRLCVRSGDVAAVAGHLAGRLIPEAVPSTEAGNRRFAAGAPLTLGLETGVLDQIVDDLQRHTGESIIIAGPRQPAAVHALVHVLNDRLGNVGKTVAYTPEPDAVPQAASIKALAEAIAGGGVSTLVILGGDPVYDAPADLDMAAKLKTVRTTVHLSTYDNQTSRLCTWHVPRAHYLEAWGDARSFDGTLGIVQPLIEPLFGGKSAIEMLAVIVDDQTTGYDITRRTFASITGARDPERLWRRTLHDGFLAGSAFSTETPSLRRGAMAAAVDGLWEQWPQPQDTELVFVPDTKVFDGRYANNGWLQELPDPITKLTWDNAVQMGPDAARSLGVETGDMVRIALDGRELTGPVLVTPGQHPASVTLPLGYGQALGTISTGAGFSAYDLRASATMGVARGATIEKAGGSYVLATTQHHHAIDSVGGEGTQTRLPTIFREATLAEYRADPDFAGHREHVVHRLSLWPEKNLEGADYAWALSIDLSACTGCSACVIACQAENNIPIVGKDQVKRGREMQWLRIDRYFRGTDPQAPAATALQPVPCMMCENAPCEQVCPVAATTHDKDGLNVMVYNRCVGTRYCSNNCPYKVRRFNYFDYVTRDPVREAGMMAVKPDYYERPQSDADPLRRLQFNPDVTVRTRGVMEKCTYCIQRIAEAKIKAKNAWVKLTKKEKAADPRVTVPDGSFTTACAQACPAEALVFGDLNDPTSRVAKLVKAPRSYEMLEELNTKPRTRYLAKLRNPAPALEPEDVEAESHPG